MDVVEQRTQEMEAAGADPAVYKGIWCYAEYRHGRMVPTVYELLHVGKQLAQELREELAAVLIGDQVGAVAQDLIEHGADRVFVYDHPLFKDFLDDAYASALADLARREKPGKVLLPASIIGRSLASRLAILLKTGASSDVTQLSVDSQTRGLRSIRSAYGGNLLAEISCKTRRPEVVTVRPMAFPKALPSPGRRGTITAIPVDAEKFKSRARFLQFIPEGGGEMDIASAEKIVSGGRGLGGPKGFDLIREFARALGAAVGASRATVDAGWIPYRHQVGLTGRTVRPRLYVACGISGQIQHLAGMSSSEVIVAINTDAEAPMMKLATFSILGDLYEIIPAIISQIKKQRG